ncbi:hypothetical protein M413DRAFT_31283 [Hebeloma cylindrosporum]|uniref:SAP domain-containing protein n=1 Tax=Hebeloma cylindrosporum TaxID=76867 RepID=A0A0C3BJH5_HEBCY|nr:hypothetical protein M413DRAFT_31283 [Hebeloma cylindrosporum h7]
MTSVSSLPEPTFTKPITAMTIVELRQACQTFQLPQTGIFPTLRNRLQNYLAAHKHELQHDYDYVALYPTEILFHSETTLPLTLKTHEQLAIGMASTTENQPHSHHAARQTETSQRTNASKNTSKLFEHPPSWLNAHFHYTMLITPAIHYLGIAPRPEPPVVIPRISTATHSSRPHRELGGTVAGGGFIVPDVIREKLRKWETHVPLTYLTDKFCTSQPASQSSLSDFLAVVDSQVTAKSKSLSCVGELTMTFDEWHQAWQRLLKLIGEYHPDEVALWHTHYTSIMVKETRSEDWALWLAYDIKIRRRSVINPLDPSLFHRRLFDDLYVRYTTERILAQVQAASDPSPLKPSPSRFQPYQRAADSTYTALTRGDSFRAQA